MPPTPNTPGTYPNFLDNGRSYNGYFYSSDPWPDKPTFANGITAPHRLDFAKVGIDVDYGRPQMLEERTVHLGARPFTLILEVAETTPGNQSEYDLKIISYGLTDQDAQNLLGYLETRINVARKDWLADKRSDFFPTWYADNDQTCTSLPKLNLDYLPIDPGAWHPYVVQFSPLGTQIVIEYYDGVASHPGLTQDEAAERNLTWNTAGNTETEWNGEGIGGPHMASDIEHQEPFLAVSFGGVPAATKEPAMQGIDTQFWLFAAAEALREYRLSGLGVQAAFERMVNIEFSTTSLPGIDNEGLS